MTSNNNVLITRLLPIALLVLYLLSSGCWSSSRTQHYPSSTLAKGFTGDWWTLKPGHGTNNVFVLRQTAGVLFPPIVGHAYLFLEVSPALLVNNSKLEIPSQDVMAIVCQEVHPGFWCAPAAGDVTLLRVLPNWIDIWISVKATSQEGFSKGQVKGFKKGLAFEKIANPFPGMAVPSQPFQ